MAKKKKPKGAVDETRLVTVPEIAPEGAPFVEVAYSHRAHRESHECCGVTFEPGHVLTFRSAADVPQEMRDDPELLVVSVPMGACRKQTSFRYTKMEGAEFNVLKAQAEAAVEPEPEPLPDEAEPPEPEGDE